MWRYQYPQAVKNQKFPLKDAGEAVSSLAVYLCQEHGKGKIPLVIAGAGVSSGNLIKLENEEEVRFRSGLPCLGGIIRRLSELVEAAAEVPGQDDQELKKLAALFLEPKKRGSDKLLDNLDREWLGKVFSALDDSPSQTVRKVWDEFCRWFFFRCCREGAHEGGALDIRTSESAQEIAKLYEKLDAICLSANFDDFLEYALGGVGSIDRGISLFSQKHANRYFRRNRRGQKEFDDIPHNRCVLHANGDVLWLHCDGDKDEGYCPQRGKYIPAFHNRRNIGDAGILKCQICGSRMMPTMTMPGTYEKDHNTRQIISSIWEHLASKVSCVITVGLSCNWDEVLLKFVLELLLEREIPHLDINNFSDPDYTGDTAVFQRIVSERRFQSCCIDSDAREGLQALNRAIDVYKGGVERLGEAKTAGADEGDMPAFAAEALSILEGYDEIQRLKHVSQLGLKALIVEQADENDRWSHSKEVADNACRMYRRLCKNSRKRENPFEQVLLYMAGLLHDCGHLPFSHLLEDVFEELSWGFSDGGSSFKHDQFSKILVRRMCAAEHSPLREFLARYGVSPEEVILLIEGNYGIGYLDTLINSAVDADKIAYIFVDAKQMQRALMLNKQEFLDKLVDKAYITQEGLVAFDSSSAWYALRLLDERKRLYDELYLDPRIRGIEAAAKYIITTYFVQKHNVTRFSQTEQVFPESGMDQSDLGGYRIMLAVNDMIGMADGTYQEVDLSASVGEMTKRGLARCKGIIEELEGGDRGTLEEKHLLLKMYRQLIGPDWEGEEEYSKGEFVSYQDNQIQEMANQLTFRQLADVRKRIILNYPGTILIDLYMPVRYYATPSARRRRRRLDGTNCAQDTILLPANSRSQWMNEECLASIPLSEYAERYDLRNPEHPVFQVFRIGHDKADCEHAINMLKKELQKQISSGSRRSRV